MDRQFKVLHVIPSVALSHGGPAATMRITARALTDAGLEVHVATTDANRRGRLDVPYGKPVVEEGVTYWYFPRQTYYYTFSWPLSRWLARHVREYDLVHIHALFSYAAIPAAFWSRRYGIPYIVRPLGTLNRWGMQNRRPWLKRISFRLVERRILAHAAAVLYTSEQERLEAEGLGVSRQSVIIPNAVDIPAASRDHISGHFRARHPELNGRRVLLFLSRLDPIKGIDILISAFAQVRAQNPDVILVLAGNGDPTFVARLQQEAARLRVAQDILWAGFLNCEEKWAALADADIFVLPSYSENFGVAIVEAMAFGLPVVISDQVGIHHDISEAQAGFVIPCEADALSEALTRLINNAELRTRMGENGRYLARTRFSLQTVTDQLIRLYKETTHLLPEPVSI